MRYIICLLMLLLMSSCLGVKGNPKPENTGLAGFRVEFADNFDPGTSENRLDAASKYDFSVNIYALNYDDEIMTDYNGLVELDLQHGKIKSVVRTEVVNGKAEDFPVEMQYALGKERVVVHEIVLDEENSTTTSPVYKKTGKMGVSPEIYPPIATIHDIQGTVSDTKGYPSKYNERNFTIKGNEMVVTAVMEGGFYLAEVGVEDYGSIYLYTYSTPYVDDAGTGYSLPVGAIIEEANGSVFEFYGFTEMSFPTFTPKYVEQGGKKKIFVDESLIPAPFDITDELSSETELEKKEAAIVTVKGVTVDWFNENDSSFIEYGQFPLKTESGSYIMAQTLYTASSFDPVAERDRDPKREFNVTGILKQHTSARPSTRIIVPRDNKDIEIAE